MNRFFSLALCLSLAPAVFAGKATITRDEFGPRWPFTVDEAVLECNPPNHIVLTAAGKRYTIIGTSNPQNNDPGPQEIMASRPGMPTIKMDLGPIIFQGLRLCRQP